MVSLFHIARRDPVSKPVSSMLRKWKLTLSVTPRSAAWSLAKPTWYSEIVTPSTWQPKR